MAGRAVVSAAVSAKAHVWRRLSGGQDPDSDRFAGPANAGDSSGYKPLLHHDVSEQSAAGYPTQAHFYGATQLSDSPENPAIQEHDSPLGRVPEEDVEDVLDEEEEEDWELEERDLYRGEFDSCHCAFR
jgi:hypothetical protein